MSQHVTAIYDHGVLKPLTPLDLEDQEVVSLSIEKVAKDRPETDATEPTLYDILDEVGLIGCIKDAPPDLSTNPKYMEGFGKSGN
ncbi:MAG TPA: antitoxin family protein [Lacipirellulaceae bacterium]